MTMFCFCFCFCFCFLSYANLQTQKMQPQSSKLVMDEHLQEFHQWISVDKYTFFMEETIDAYDNIVISFLSTIRQPYPCVRIEFDRRPQYTTAYLQGLQYYRTCSIRDKELENHSGTIIMVKAALTYMLDKYSYIREVHLQDETFIDIPSKPLITPRRLLLGEKGWYEEYFGAIPENSMLDKKIQMLRQKDVQTRIRAFLPIDAEDKTWWIPTNIQSVCDYVSSGLARYLVGSSWVIPSKTIRTYDITYTIQPASIQRGGSNMKSRDNATVSALRRLNNILSKGRTGAISRYTLSYT